MVTITIKLGKLHLDYATDEDIFNLLAEIGLNVFKSYVDGNNMYTIVVSGRDISNTKIKLIQLYINHLAMKYGVGPIDVDIQTGI